MKSKETERTILFADVCNSTGLTEAIGNVASRQHIAEILDVLGKIAESHDGAVVKTIGDEIMTSFPSPLQGLLAAVEMQRAVREQPPIEGLPPQIRVGLNAGEVLEEGGDVFGDVVNVSARIVHLAAGDQILTTKETIESAGEDGVAHRSLGTHAVRGRDAQLNLCEVLWRGETAQITVMAPRVELGPTPELEIKFGETVLSLASDSGKSLTIGRGTECSLVVPSASASRSHAAIIARGGRFYLEDHSTNGTYLWPEGAHEVFVHRDQAQLQGSGHIRLGEPISVLGPLDIAYETRYSD